MLSPSSASLRPPTRRRGSGGGTIEHCALIGLLGALVTVTVFAVDGQLDAFLRDESCGFFRLLNPMDHCQSSPVDDTEDRASLSLGRPTQQANAVETLGDVLAGMDRRGDLFDPKREYQVAHNTHAATARDYGYNARGHAAAGASDRDRVRPRPAPSSDYERAESFALAQLTARNPVAARRYERIKDLEEALSTSNKRLADYLPLSTAEQPLSRKEIRSTARRRLSEKVVDDALPLMADLGFDAKKVHTREGFGVEIVGAVSHHECLASGLPDDFCEVSRILEENARSPNPTPIVIDPLLAESVAVYGIFSAADRVEETRIRLSVSVWREALVGHMTGLAHELAHHDVRQRLRKDPSFPYVGKLKAHVPPKLEHQIRRCIEAKRRNCNAFADLYFRPAQRSRSSPRFRWGEDGFSLDEIYTYKLDASTELAVLQRLERKVEAFQSGGPAPDVSLREVEVLFEGNSATVGLFLAEASVNTYVDMLHMLHGTPRLGDRPNPRSELHAVYEESMVDGKWAGALVSPSRTDRPSPTTSIKVPFEDKVSVELRMPLRGVRDEEIFHEDVSAWNSAHSILLDYLGRQLEVFSDDVRELREMEEATNALRANLKEQLKRLTSG